MRTRGSAIPEMIGLVLLLLVSVAFIFWLYATIRIRRTFVASSSGWPSAIAVGPFDVRSGDFLAGTRTGWEIRESDTNGPFSGFMQVNGLSPSVRSLTNLLLAPTPRYSWWSQSRNRRALAQGTAKEAMAGMATIAGSLTNEPTILLSADAHAALVWCGEDNVLLFKDGTNGMVEQRYWRSKHRDD